MACNQEMVIQHLQRFTDNPRLTGPQKWGADAPLSTSHSLPISRLGPPLCCSLCYSGHGPCNVS